MGDDFEAGGPPGTIHARYSADEIDAFYVAGLWQPLNLYQLIADRAGTVPDRRFCFDSTTSYTYREFHDRVLRVSIGLRRLGVNRGDRIVVQLPNWTEFPIVAGALSRLGAILVPIMPIYRGDEVGYILRHSGASGAITCGEFRGFDHAAMFAELSAEAERLSFMVEARGSRGDATPFEDLVASGELADLEAEGGDTSSPDDGLLIVYTSGTTSRPKGCYHSFNTVHASAWSMAGDLGYTSEDVQFGPSPVTHSTGLVTSVVLPLLVGAQTHLMEVWEPGEGLRRIEEYGCTATVTATPFLQMLLNEYDPQKHDASSLRLWVCAGSPIPSAVVEDAQKVLPNCRTLSLYGRSENFVTTMCTLADDPDRAITSDGSPVRGAAVKIVDAEGHEVPPGVDGDIAYHGPSHMIEYYANQGETEALFTWDGYSRSGDLGRMDIAGFVRVTGRIKDIIIRGGVNISAREIEEHLLRHAAIQHVAAVGMPDERLGERVCVYVVLAAGVEDLTLDEVTTYLRSQKVATPKLPERLEITSELPMTATGKIQKNLLRADVSAKVKFSAATGTRSLAS
jgi:cyclohexanecarboxylate-CoA ligase